jgi:hypothetical protein
VTIPPVSAIERKHLRVRLAPPLAVPGEIREVQEYLLPFPYDSAVRSVAAEFARELAVIRRWLPQVTIDEGTDTWTATTVSGRLVRRESCQRISEGSWKVEAERRRNGAIDGHSTHLLTIRPVGEDTSCRVESEAAVRSWGLRAGVRVVGDRPLRVGTRRRWGRFLEDVVAREGIVWVVPPNAAAVNRPTGSRAVRRGNFLDTPERSWFSSGPGYVILATLVVGILTASVFMSWVLANLDLFRAFGTVYGPVLGLASFVAFLVGILATVVVARLLQRMRPPVISSAGVRFSSRATRVEASWDEIDVERMQLVAGAYRVQICRPPTLRRIALLDLSPSDARAVCEGCPPSRTGPRPSVRLSLERPPRSTPSQNA